jgi:sirohydrochlorin ferrochelatase
LAADNGVFRPLNRYAAFATVCDRLAMVTADDLRSWTDQRKQFGGGIDAVGAALAAQPWAARAGTTALDLVTVADCLRNSRDEVNARLRQLIGETPEELEGHIRTKVGGLSETIAQLSDER